MKRLAAITLVVVTALAASRDARANSVTVGAPGPSGPNAGNCIPFGCDVFDASGERWQQVYSGSLFSGPLLIQYISFFNNNFLPGYVDPASYTLELSTTSKAPFGLSSTFGDNVGADHVTVFSGTLGGPGTIVNGIFTIPLTTSFTFNPAGGNLLLMVTKTGGTDVSNDPIPDPTTVYLDIVNTGTTSTSRLFGRLLTGGGISDAVERNNALVTEFSDAAPVPVPEPATLLLTGLGLAGAAVRRRRASRSPLPLR